MSILQTARCPCEAKIGRRPKLTRKNNTADKKSFKQNQGESISFDHYHSLDSINKYMESLEKRFPQRVRTKHVGQSFEQKPLKTIRISNGDGRSDKYVIFVEAGAHGREWITPASALYIIYQLVECYEANKELLLDFDWLVLPLVNPDGYEYSRCYYFGWRKSRSKHWCFCPGVDINRNFDICWKGNSSSSDPCSEIYRGPTAFSEAESCVIKDLMMKLGRKVKFYLSLHSYGPMILYPWGYKRGSPNGVALVAKAGVDAILKSKNILYTHGGIADALYPVSGASADYAVEVANIPISIVMELPGKGYGFHPPTYRIKECIEEAWIGIKAMAMCVINECKNFKVNYKHKNMSKCKSTKKN